jgi:trk system potassium uptake protein TrkH
MSGIMQRMHPAKLVILGYLSYAALGWIALCIPLAQRGAGVSALDNLFISASALSTTGLATISIADNYSLFGQIVILLSIQAGGIGYMTFGSFLILSRTSGLPATRTRVGRTVFSLPESFRIDKFIRSVVAFTLLIELAGVAALYPILRGEGVPSPLWSAIFHSISAFCTAGFSLYNSSFEAYVGSFWLNLTIGVLSYLGAIGFIVCVDCTRVLTGEIRRITLTSKIILWSTFWLSVGGAMLLFLTDPALRSLPVDQRLMASAFQSMSALTTVGFDTVGISQLSHASMLVLIVLMIVGASPSGTGGGLKCTTFSALIGVMLSAVRGDAQVRFWGRIVPLERIWTAVASLGYYLAMLLLGIFLLEITETAEFEQNLFEAVSALGTVGLSTGITPSLTSLGKLIVIFLMFCGRVGPLTFGIALFFRDAAADQERDQDLAI